MVAVARRHNTLARLLLNQPGLEVNQSDRVGLTALHCAAGVDNLEGMRLVMGHPAMASLNSRNAGGRTPLMSAVWGGSLACVRELVATEGVHLATRDRQGKSLEEVATHNMHLQLANHEEVLQVLREVRQAQEERVWMEGGRPVEEAVEMGRAIRRTKRRMALRTLKMAQPKFWN